MSSLTIPIRIRRWPERPALRFDPDEGDPGRPAGGAGGDELGGGEPVRHR